MELKRISKTWQRKKNNENHICNSPTSLKIYIYHEHSKYRLEELFSEKKTLLRNIT